MPEIAKVINAARSGSVSSAHAVPARSVGPVGMDIARAHSAAPPNAVPASAATTPGEPALVAAQPTTATDSAATQKPRRSGPVAATASCGPADMASTVRAAMVTPTATMSRLRSRDARTTRAATTVTASEPASTDWTW
jgi:hypothetical protein